MEENTINPLDDLDTLNSFEPYLIDVRKDVKEKQYHFYLNGIGFAPIGNIQAIKAKAKNGKTQFTKILMASALCGDTMGIQCGIENSSILYIDTEQDPDDSIRVLQGVLSLCNKTDSKYKYNEPSDRLHGLALRTVSTTKRWEYTKDAIETYKPTLVIIDGVRDLIVDFNDLDESSNIIGELMKYSTDYNCSIISILHENKNDSNMRGHLGTEMVNKVTDVLEPRKETDISGDTYFVVEQTETRNRDIDKFQFIINDFGVPDIPHMSCEAISQIRLDMEKCHEEMWRKHNSDNKYGLRKTDFIDTMMSVLAIKKSMAYNKFNDAINQRIIEIDKTSKQVMIVHNMPKDDFSNGLENSNEMPF